MMPRQLTTGAGWRRKTKGQELHAIKTFTQTGEVFKIHPVNAIHRTRLDRFLDASSAVTVLTDRPRTPEAWLNHEGIGGDVGAVPAADAHRFVDPDRFVPQSSAEYRLKARSLFSHCG